MRLQAIDYPRCSSLDVDQSRRYLRRAVGRVVATTIAANTLAVTAMCLLAAASASRREAAAPAGFVWLVSDVVNLAILVIAFRS